MAKRNKEIRWIANHYGIELQMKKALEEVNELIEELEYYIKDEESYKRCFIPRLEDEIADVEIMLTQIKMLLSISENVESRKEFKIARQLKRISEEGMKNEG